MERTSASTKRRWSIIRDEHCARAGRHVQAVLTPSSAAAKVSRDTPFSTPWRVILISPDAPHLYESNKLILNLNEPNQLGDVSWSARKYVGIWWGMPRHPKLGFGPKHGATTAYAEKMIDFAAKNGFTGLLVEGGTRAGTATGSRRR
jgi:alpha-glucosidase